MVAWRWARRALTRLSPTATTSSAPAGTGSSSPTTGTPRTLAPVRSGRGSTSASTSRPAALAVAVTTLAWPPAPSTQSGAGDISADELRLEGHERLLGDAGARQVGLGAAVLRVEVREGGLQQLGRGTKQALELRARHAVALGLLEQALAQRLDAGVGEREVLEHDLAVDADGLEDQRGEEPGAVLAGGAVEQRGARRVSHEPRRLREGGPGVVEGREVELRDVEAVGDLAPGGVDVRPDLHVVDAVAGAREEAAGLALALHVTPQVDDGREREPLQEVEVGVGEGGRPVGAQDAPGPGQAAASHGVAGQVAGVERALERQEAGVVTDGDD